MEFEEGQQVWIDDGFVDIPRKPRTTRNNRKISKHYERFSPNDLNFDIDDLEEFNPSVNKATWHISDEFDERMNYKADLLNKCGQRDLDEVFKIGRQFDLNKMERHGE